MCCEYAEFLLTQVESLIFAVFESRRTGKYQKAHRWQGTEIQLPKRPVFNLICREMILPGPVCGPAYYQCGQQLALYHRQCKAQSYQHLSSNAARLARRPSPRQLLFRGRGSAPRPTFYSKWQQLTVYSFILLAIETDSNERDPDKWGRAGRRSFARPGAALRRDPAPRVSSSRESARSKLAPGGSREDPKGGCCLETRGLSQVSMFHKVPLVLFSYRKLSPLKAQSPGPVILIRNNMADSRRRCEVDLTRQATLTVKRLTFADFVRLREKLKPAIYNKATNELRVSDGSLDEISSESGQQSPHLNDSFNGN